MILVHDVEAGITSVKTYDSDQNTSLDTDFWRSPWKMRVDSIEWNDLIDDSPYFVESSWESLLALSSFHIAMVLLRFIVPSWRTEASGSVTRISNVVAIHVPMVAAMVL